MDKGSRLDLSKYRFANAEENVIASKELLNNGHNSISVSRSYYAIFYALLAVTELDGFESAKHSGVISYFNRSYVKTKIFAPDISKRIDNAFKQRRYADYEGLCVISAKEAQARIEDAEAIINMIEPYLKSRWAELTSQGSSEA